MTKRSEPTAPGMARRDVLKLAGAAMVGISGAALAASPALAAGNPPPEGIGFFALSANGLTTAVFKSLLELRMAAGHTGDKAAPQFVAVLSTGTRLEADFYAWFSSALSGKKSGKRDAVLTAYDLTATPILKWDLTGASPSEILTSSTATALLTQVTLVADSIAPA